MLQLSITWHNIQLVVKLKKQLYIYQKICTFAICNTLIITINNTDMEAQEIDDKLKHVWVLFSDAEKNYIRKDHALALDPRQVYHTYTLGTPMISKEVRILLVKKGTAKYTIGYQKYSIKAGDLLMVPPNVIFSMDWKSDDFYPYGLTFTLQFAELDTLNNARILSMLDEVLHLKLEGEDITMLSSFFLKMKCFLDNGTPDLSGFKSIIKSFLYMLLPLSGQNNHVITNNSITRRHEVFQAFLKLLRGMAIPERSISYYATALSVTENYLSTSVKEESGRTVMQFINEKTVSCIKIYLNEGLILDEISEKTKLGNSSSLIRFFKKETGETPTEYRSRMRKKVTVVSE